MEKEEILDLRIVKTHKQNGTNYILLGKNCRNTTYKRITYESGIVHLIPVKEENNQEAIIV